MVGKFDGSDSSMKPIEQEFDFGDEGKFKLKLYPGKIVIGKHLCSDRITDQFSVYGPSGTPINFRVISQEKAAIFCSLCGARVVFQTNFRENSTKSLKKALESKALDLCSRLS